MIKAAVVGSTGYAGQELVRILMRHPEVEVVSTGSHSYVGKPLKEVYPLYEDISELICENLPLNDLAQKADVIFLALPHGLSSKQVTEEVLDQAKVIDLGADFRLKNINVYQEWYNVKHYGQEIIKEAVYGLVELHRDEIKKARLIGNPGCYTTCSILTLAPLVKAGVVDTNSIVIDAKSGVTGAGRGEKLANLFCEVNESVKAYKVAAHRHTPEIEQELGLLANQDIKLLFTPILVPMNRGILSCCYAKLNQNIDENDVLKLYSDFYKDEYFVRFIGNKSPETRWVKGTNFCDIGVKIDKRTNRVIAMGAIDNLVKGAAGQAVQNMNLLFGLDEKTGIDFVTDFPV